MAPRRKISVSKMLAMFLLAGPPLASLVFFTLWGLAGGQFGVGLMMVLNLYGVLATYCIFIIPSALTFFGYSIARAIVKKPGAQVVAAAFIGTLVYLGTGGPIIFALFDRTDPTWMFTAFFCAAHAVSASICASMVNIHLAPSS